MATIYITESGAGAQTGVDAANAHSAAWFNTAANWGGGAGEINPGDTVVFSGTITSQLTVQASGTAGNVITFLWESGAKLSRTAGTLISCTNKSYLKFDGGTNGIIENTANGTSLANQVAASGIYASGSSNIEVARLAFRNLYVNDPTQDTVPDFSTHGAVYFNGVGSNISIHDCTFDHICWVLNLQGGDGSGVQIYGNTFTNFDHGVAGLGGMSEIDIYDNDFGSTAIWDTPGNIWHHDGIHVFFGAGITCTGLRIYCNRFSGDWGTNNTAHIFIEGDYTHANEAAVEARIWNNLHIQEAANALNNGFLAAVGVLNVWANTFAGSSVSNSLGIALKGTNLDVRNNLIAGVRTFINVQQRAGSVDSTISLLDNNLYAAQAGGGNSAFALNGSNKTTLAEWQSSTGADANSILVSDALLDGNYAPQVGSSAIDAGTDLSAYFTTDYNGDPRNDPWDIGAIRFVNSMADSLTLTQTANTDPVAEVWYEREVGSGSFTHVVRRHSGPYPSQPVNGYERPAAWGKNNVWVYIFRDEGQDDETFIADSLS